MAKKYNMDKIALDLLTCHTDIEVCEKNNISETTLFRIRKNDDFKKIMEETKEKLFSDTIKKSQSYSLEALDILMEIGRDVKVSPNARINACGKILDLGQAMNDKEVILKRLEELESRLADNEES